MSALAGHSLSPSTMTTGDYESLDSRGPAMNTVEHNNRDVENEHNNETLSELQRGQSGQCDICKRLTDDYNQCAQRLQRLAEELREHIAHAAQAKAEACANRERNTAEFWASGSYTIDGADNQDQKLPHFE